MTVIAIIPARQNSKRLAGKNLMELGGRPLIAYSVLIARSIPEIDRVVVASDGPDNMFTGVAFGARACWLPSYLTRDNATLLGTLRYTIGEITRQAVFNPGPSNDTRVDWVVLLQPTSPLRLLDQCRGWIQEVLATPEVDGLLTVDLEPYKLGSATPLGYYRPEYTPGTIKQQVEPRMRENGLFYMLKADNIRRGELFGPRMLPRTCRREASLANIDYQFDFDFTCWAYEKYGYKAEFERMEVALG